MTIDLPFLLPAPRAMLAALGVMGVMALLGPDPEARAQVPVVLELYTSQGCTACPPADALMGDLAQRDDVIALALHVDYWDYIGWADTFGHPAHGDRQRRYARRFGAGTIYTPQAVIGGIEVHEGFRVGAVLAAIEAQAQRPALFDLELRAAEGNAVEIRARRRDAPDPGEAGEPLAMAEATRPRSQALQMLRGALQPESAPARMQSAQAAPAAERAPESLVVQLVSYLPAAEVEIATGENAGRHARYHNIVRDWQVLGNWDTGQPLRMTVRRGSDLPVVILLQDPGQGTIRAAARLR